MTDHPTTDSSRDDNGDAFSPSIRDLTGCSMGDLQVLRRLGRGGMADVYLAMQQSLDRQVAVKVLRAQDANYVERFRREARAAARLSHPNIVQVYEVNQWEGLHYISQEYVDGLNLRERIDRDGPLSLQQGLTVMLGVGAALDAASAQGITHRDIKPENIMLSSREDVKVADFGLARISTDFKGELTQVGLTMGTPLYMSPEQVQGEKVDVRSDLYSLGVTMFHVLTGRPPFEGDTPLAIAVKQLHESPPRMSESRIDDHIPRWLDEVILRLMHKEPERRFDSPASLLEYLQKKIAGEGSLKNIGTSPIRLEATRELQLAMDEEPKKRSHPGWIVAVALPVLALIAGMIYAKQNQLPSIASRLNANTQGIERQDSVQRQYFEAMRRNTPGAWEAVWTNFPIDESSENRLYAAKARIQLARLYTRQDAYEDVTRIIKPVVADLELPSVIVVIAMGYEENALLGRNQNDEAARVREALQSKFNDLSQADQGLFQASVPSGVRDRLSSSS